MRACVCVCVCVCVVCVWRGRHSLGGGGGGGTVASVCGRALEIATSFSGDSRSVQAHPPPPPPPPTVSDEVLRQGVSRPSLLD